MSGRLDFRGNVALQRAMTSVVQHLNQLKVPNQAVGSDSVVILANQTANTNDISYTMAPNTQQTWRVTFTPAYMQNVYASLYPSGSWTGGTGYESTNFYPDINNTSSTSRSWIFVANSDANTATINTKFYVLAPDSGTITVTAL